jgi:hypothetical protein
LNRFLFLDIDGVLNSSRSVIVKIGPKASTSQVVADLADLAGSHGYGVQEGLLTADPICVALVNKLVEAGGEDMVLVLSSTHRKFLYDTEAPYGSDEHLRRLRHYLTTMGLNVPARFSITPNLHVKRGLEIDQWLNHAYENGAYDDDEPYVILDDAADMLPDQPLVRVDPRHGLSFEDYAEACKHLRLKEPGLILL